jgi:membrane-bound lytic murein transglycosylase MltF
MLGQSGMPGNEYADGMIEDDTNKLLFAFAAYNAGPGRIHSLREEAPKKRLDPNVWVDNVEMIAAEKIGMETVTYVANIYKYYIAYKLVAQQEVERKKSEGISGERAMTWRSRKLPAEAQRNARNAAVGAVEVDSVVESRSSVDQLQ